ncbi:MAG: hypothetical protein FWD14_01985 [Treponema sp.]|nr:hypothetical protein [Treponema sp.]
MDYSLILKRNGDIEMETVLDLIREENGIDDDWEIEIDIDGNNINWSATKNVEINIDDNALINHALESNQLSHEDYSDSDVEVE